MLGTPLLAWQQQVGRVVCELTDNGTPAWREVVVTVPRQSGKTSLAWAWCVTRALLWPRQPQRIAWTAQTGRDGRAKWLDELVPAMKQSEVMRFVESIPTGIGSESVRFRNGSVIRLLSTSPSAGHGVTLDAAVMDELWADEDDRREQMLRPAMITRRDAQLLVVSTAGTPSSVILDRKVQAGRAAVERDDRGGLAYFEWSADPASWDPADEDAWWTWMPVLGELISPEAVRAELATMAPEEFRRAYGNLPSRAMQAGIPEMVWASACDPAAAPSGELTWAVEVSYDRNAACVVVSDGVAVELVEHRPGTAWLVERVAGLVASHGGTVVVDAGGPAGALAEVLGAQRATGRDVIDATEAFSAAVAEGRVRIRPDPSLDQAARGVVTRRVGDRLAWSRRDSSVDVGPLVAAALAWWSAARLAARGAERVDPVSQVW